MCKKKNIFLVKWLIGLLALTLVGCKLGDNSLKGSLGEGNPNSLIAFSIESDPGGSGQQYSALNLISQEELALFSVKRNKGGAYIGNESVSWGTSGSVGTLSIIGDGTSANFIAANSNQSGSIRIYQNGILLEEILVTVTVTDELILSDLQVSSVTHNGFDVSVQSLGDANGNGSLSYAYCNVTDNGAGCTPTGSTPMIENGIRHELSIANLIAPNEGGDTLKILVSATDPDGVTNNALTSQVTMAVPVLSNFSITGVTSGNESLLDDHLSNSLSPTIHWTASTNASEYDVTIYEDNGSTVKCSPQTTTGLSFDTLPTGCNLSLGNYYKAAVKARYAGVATRDADNHLFRFYVNHSPTIGTDGEGAWYVQAGSSIAIDALWTASPGVGVATDSEGHSLSFTSIANAAIATNTLSNNGSNVLYTASAGTFGKEFLSYTISDDKGGTHSGNLVIHVVQEYTWTGALSTSWSIAGNWCNTIAGDKKGCTGHSSLPGSSKTIIFDETCESAFTCSPATTGSINVKGVRIGGNGFSQTPGHNITIGSENWIQTNGAFVGGTGYIDFNYNSLTVIGGLFQSTSGSMEIRENLTVALPGVFSHNNGTIKIEGNGSDTSRIDVTGSSLYNLTLQKRHSVAEVIGSVQVDGLLNHNMSGGGGGRLRNGEILAAGDVVVNNGAVEFSTLITLNGSSNQTVTGNSEHLGKLKIASTGGTVSFVGTLGLINEFTYVSGNVDMTGSTISFQGNGIGNSVITPGVVVFDNLTFSKSFNSHTVSGDLHVNGNLHCGDSNNTTISGSFTMYVKGNLTSTGSRGCRTSNTLVLNGSGAQTINLTTQNLPKGLIDINKPSGTVTLLSQVDFLGSGQDFIITQGTVDLNGMSLNVADFLTIDTLGVLNVNGGSYSPNSLPKFINNGTLIP